MLIEVLRTLHWTQSLAELIQTQHHALAKVLSSRQNVPVICVKFCQILLCLRRAAYPAPFNVIDLVGLIFQ
jgi:hypothetical protein